MKNITGLIVMALVFAGLGGIGLAAARVQEHLADAQQQVSTQLYDDASASLASASRFAEFTRWVPGIGDDTLREIAAREAAIKYWQRDYTGLIPAGDPVAAVDERNPPLQMVVANAVFRAGLEGTTERQALLQALEEAASAYQTVLRGDAFEPDAAFNYEYTVRLRDNLSRGQRPPLQQPDGDLGESGAPAPETKMQGFEIYIPLESQEKSPTGGDAGKASTKDRKG